MFKFTKKNVLQGDMTQALGLVSLKRTIQGREGDFIEALITTSSGVLTRDLIVLLELDTNLFDLLKEASKGETYKKLMFLKTIFLLSCFQDLEGFFESFKMDIKVIINELKTLFKNNKMEIYLKNLNPKNNELIERIQFEANNLTKILKINMETGVPLAYHMYCINNAETLNFILSQTIQIFKQKNPGDIIE